MSWFDTPLKAAALGVLLVAAVVLGASVTTGRERLRAHVLALVTLALGMVLLSRAIH